MIKNSKINILAQGAEAIIIRDKNQIIKRRLSKSYRLPILDEQIRKLRTRNESKILEKASHIIPVPKVLKTDEKTKEIFIEFIDGKKLSENLDNFPIKEQKQIMEQIGQSIAKLHNEGIIHGDLTTSNMIYVLDKDSRINCSQPKDNGSENFQEKIISEAKVKIRMKVRVGEKEIQCRKLGGKVNNLDNFKIFFIDFGLSFHSQKYEDKAVDIHLLRQALEAKHFTNWEELYKEFISSYKKTSKDNEKVLMQLEKVEKRGRYKEH